MIEIALLGLLLSEHNSFHWEMTCADWNQARIEILSDHDLTADAKEYLIDYFRVKVPDEQCETFIIGRK